MTTLCQVTVVDNEKEFLNRLKKDGHAHHFPTGGWGRFTGEIPAIGTSFTVHYPESENREPNVFRVLYHHRCFNSEPYSTDAKTTARHLQIGDNTLEVCHVFVVKLSLKKPT